jgi:tetratricopeptide (TPR) repeat protein
LVNVEVPEGFNIPYLRFHPTLPYAARPTDLPDLDAAEERFIAVYLNVRQIACDALRGSQPAAGMALVAREEANFRAAINRTFGRGNRQDAWSMADTLGLYLQSAGRLRERDTLVEWSRAQLGENTLDAATCEAIGQHAWSRFTQGHADEALQRVQDLITRLESRGVAGGEDPAFQLALSNSYLGRIYYHSGRADLSLEPLNKEVAGFERLGDKGRANLATALEDLANAYRHLGRFDDALEASEQGLAIYRQLGNTREIAVGEGRSAEILATQGRYGEADARYGEALATARSAAIWDCKVSPSSTRGSCSTR